MAMLVPLADASARDAVLRATRMWLERAVIGLNLCPFAKAVYVKHRIRFAVTGATDIESLRSELTHELEWLRDVDATHVETTLLIHPHVLTDFIDFHRFLARADAKIKQMGLRGAVQVASFHPDYQFAGSASDDIANFTNRSPYPMLHLLRETSIDRAVAAIPDASTIVDANVETLCRLGHDGWRRLMR